MGKMIILDPGAQPALVECDRAPDPQEMADLLGGPVDFAGIRYEGEDAQLFVIDGTGPANNEATALAAMVPGWRQAVAGRALILAGGLRWF